MKAENGNVIGKRMKELRGSMSQRQAAVCVGIKPQNWNVYESGNSLPGAQVIINLCRHFNVSADWLLGLEAVREGSRAFPQLQSTVRPSKNVPGRGDPELMAEIAELKRRVQVLEVAGVTPTFACS